MAGNDNDRPTKASFRKSDGTEIAVQFNPMSLQHAVTNTLSQQGQGQRTQYVSQSSAKLTMDLVFDSTDTGTDVREQTFVIAQLMAPGGEEGDAERPAPEAVEFSWGTFTFTGMVESFRETIDFFAPEGIPLRAAVNLSLAKQSHVFDRDEAMGSKRHQAEPLLVPLASSDDVTSVAEKNGKPEAWRDVAKANGVENPRAVVGGALALPAGSARGPFASLGAALNGAGAVPAAVDGNTRFEVGGRAQSPKSGIGTDVGNNRSMRDALQFED